MGVFRLTGSVSLQEDGVGFNSAVDSVALEGLAQNCEKFHVA